MISLLIVVKESLNSVCLHVLFMFFFSQLLKREVNRSSKHRSIETAVATGHHGHRSSTDRGRLEMLTKLSEKAEFCVVVAQNKELEQHKLHELSCVQLVAKD